MTLTQRSSDNAEPRKTVAEVKAELQPVWAALAGCPPAPSEDPSSTRIGTVYIRESHKDSLAGLSPATQLRAVLDRAARDGVHVPWPHVFLDNVTGKTDQRPDFLSLMDLGRGGRITDVYLFHSSRFARNVAIAKRYKEELRSRGIRVTQLNLPIDTGTASGKFMETVAEAVDQFHSDTTSEWVSSVLRDKAEQGGPLGRLPEYLVRHADGTVAHHPVLATIVSEGAQRYLRNADGGDVSFADLAKWSAAEGHRTPHGSALDDEWWRNVLGQTQIAGYVAYKWKRRRGVSKPVKAAWEGIVSLEMFMRIQKARAARTRIPGKAATQHVYVLSDVAVCTCGSTVTASSAGYMRCRAAAQHRGCSQPGVRAEILETQFGSWSSEALLLTKELERDAVRIIESRLAQSSDTAAAARIRRAMAQLGKQHQWEALDDEAYLAQLRGLKQQLATTERSADLATSADALRIASSFVTAWDNASPKRRQEFVQRFFVRIVVDGGWIVSVRPKPELAPLLAARVAQDVRRSGPDRIRTGDLVLDRDVC